MKKILFLLSILILISALPNDNYTDFVKKIKEQMQDKHGDFYHATFKRLAYITDTYGPRLWGTQPLETVGNLMAQYAKDEGFDNVNLEPVNNYTSWSRGFEELVLYEPRPFPQKLSVSGLGGSISGHVLAEAIVFKGVNELAARKDDIKGKIVVFNPPWTGYYDVFDLRLYGAENASQYGAVGCLIRSISSQSIYSVHTGVQYSKKIPVGAITVEDSQMLQRMQDRGQKIQLQLTLKSTTQENQKSNNVVFDIKGSQKPDEILLMGGHLDSWDNGPQNGAADDGAGFMTCFDAMRLLIKNGFRPKRTIRFVAWTGQEWCDPKNGNIAYLKQHWDELPKHLVAFESDYGSTKLLGFGYQGSDQGRKIVQMVGEKYLTVLNASLTSKDGTMVDTTPLYEKGIPTMINLINDNQNHDFYMQFHHTAGDSMTMLNPDELDSNVLGLAALFYIMADMDDTIPLPKIKANTIQEVIKKRKCYKHI